MLYILPLENISNNNERYLNQWRRWFRDYLEQNVIEYEFIDGDLLTEKIDDGKVLDISGNVYYKNTQLAKIAKMFKEKKIKNGDKFFIFDGQFFGIESLRYMSFLYDIKIGIYCYFHASSYTKYDFTEPMKSWLRNFEYAWFRYYDKVFVGTQYHKDSIISRVIKPTDKLESFYYDNKIIVTGTPFNSAEILDLSFLGKEIVSEEIVNLFCDNKFVVIFPHRYDFEKGIDDFETIVDSFSNYDDILFLVTTSSDNQSYKYERLLKKNNVVVLENLSKIAYYYVMRSSNVFLSTTLEENVGLCLLEALTLGVVPIVRDDFSHKQFVNFASRFTEIEQAIKMLKLMHSNPILRKINYKSLIDAMDNSIDKIIKQIINDPIYLERL